MPSGCATCWRCGGWVQVGPKKGIQRKMVSPRRFTATRGRQPGKGKPWLQTEAALPDEMMLTPQLLAQFNEKDRLTLMGILKAGDVSVSDAIERIAAEKAADLPAFMSAGNGLNQMAKLTPEVLAQFSETERLHLIELVKGGAPSHKTSTPTTLRCCATVTGAYTSRRGPSCRARGGVSADCCCCVVVLLLCCFLGGLLCVSDVQD